VDVETWLKELGGQLAPERVSTGAADLDAHSYDWWPVAAKWRQQGLHPYAPAAVVRPVTTDEVSRVLAWANGAGVPVTPWGAGSSVTGAPLAMAGGLSLDLSALNRLLALDETNLVVRAQAGMMGHHLERALNSRGYTLNHSPQSLDRSTVGGWVATRATGQFSSRWGGIEAMVLALTVVLADGTVVQTPLVPRGAMGPDLCQLFIGAEGTLGVVTEVTLRMAPLAEHRGYETLRFPSVTQGLEAMRLMMRAGLRPFLLRFYDNDESRYAMRDASFTGCALFLGCEGVAPVARAEFDACLALCEANGGQTLGPAATTNWMERRFDFSLIENILAKPGGVAETIEVAHFWANIESTYRALKAALSPRAGEVLGHFSHAYPQGTSLYMILLGEVETAAEAEARLRQIWAVSMEVALQEGAAISHHHGVGIARLPYIQRSAGTSFAVLERIKVGLDPAGILNPGKLGLTASDGPASE
jgi:alkyldihydroxyacetonephosphate synthase